MRFGTNYSTVHAEKYPYLTADGLPVSSDVFYSALYEVPPVFRLPRGGVHYIVGELEKSMSPTLSKISQ